MPPAGEQKITDADVRLVEDAVKNHGLKPWWFRLTKSHFDAGDCGSLKEAIQQDFLAWCLLGSFISSIAFSSVIGTLPGADEWAKILAHVVPLEVALGPFSSRLPPIISHWGNEVDLLTCLLKSLYHTIFMFAAVKSIQGVIAGTFKYLLFVSVPPGHTCMTIAKYLSSGFSSSKGNKESVDLDSSSPPPGLFASSAWDHMTPIVDSINAVAFGTAFGVTVAHGLLVSLPLWWLLWQLRKILAFMKKMLWDVANENMEANTKASPRVRKTKAATAAAAAM